MAEKRYSKNGEWLEKNDGRWILGITKSSAEELGDVTFVAEPAIPRLVQAGQAVCALEAVKAAADLYSPVSARVVEFNRALVSGPQLVSQDPEGAGWIVALVDVSDSEWESLLSVDEWAQWENPS